MKELSKRCLAEKTRLETLLSDPYRHTTVDTNVLKDKQESRLLRSEQLLPIRR